MMKRTRNKVLLFLSLLAMFSACFCLFSLGAGAEEGGALAEQYVVGEKVVIPERTLSDGSGSAKAEAVVILPDGSARRASEITLEQAGMYTVEYRARIGTKTVREEQKFLAIQKLYTTTGARSTLRYGKDTSVFQTDWTGVNVSLAQNETFELNQIVDLNACDGQSFFRFHVLPKTRGVRDASALYIYLTDIHDPENYLTVKVQSVAYNGQTYVYIASYTLAAPNTQTLVAQDAEDPDNIRVNDRFGTGTWISFYGNGDSYGGFAPAEEFADLIYKAEEKQLWISSRKGNYLVVDFDDAKFAQYFDEPWGGFTSNEIRISCKADGYTGTHFNFLISRVAGVDLSREYASDETAPEIDVDTGTYEPETLPKAVKGATYPLFPASAFDRECGETRVDAHVYYGYGSSNAVEANVANGRIAVNYEGIYTIVYRSTDRNGNTAEKLLRFETGSVAAPAVTLNGGDRSGKVGESFALAEMTATGGSGDLIKRITAEKDGKTLELTDAFVPQETGTYTLTYSATDVTGRETKDSYQVQVNENADPVFSDRIVLPDYLILGQRYAFPEVFARDFMTGNAIAADVLVNGQKVENGIYLPQTEGTVTVKYRAESATGSRETEEKQIAVRKVTGMLDGYEVLRMEKYFDAADFAITQNPRELLFTATPASGDTGYARYINALLFSRFELGLRFDPENANFDALEVLLVDAANRANTLSIGFVKEPVREKTLVTINGESISVTLRRGGFFSGDDFRLTYANGRLSDGGDVNLKLEDLFQAEKVEISLRMKGISGAATVAVTDVNGVYPTATLTDDRTPPQALLLGAYESQYGLGTEITVFPLIAADVLQTEVTATVTVTTLGANPRTLLSNADAYRAHKVTLDAYGSYQIAYTVRDGAGRRTQISQVVYVRDDVAPVITVSGSVAKTAKVGSKIKLPDASATDEVDGTVAVKILVTDAHGNTRKISGTEYTFACKGKHIVRYLAQDAAGNLAMTQFTVTVEG